MIIVQKNRLIDYCSQVPLALGLERSVESALMGKSNLTAPILDLGCGDGIFASESFDFQLDFGLDPNVRELKRAGKTGIYKNLIHAYGNSIPLMDCSIQSVFSNSVLEHIEKLDEVMKEIYRVLKPGGSLVFTVPSQNFDKYSNLNQIFELLNLERLSSRYKKIYNRFWRHYNYMSQQDWQKYVEKFNFKTVEIFSYNPKINCQLNDFLAPFGVLGKLSKIFLNQWTFVSNLRRVLLLLITPVLMKFVERTEINKDGGLVYVHVRKPVED